jgi:dCTP deaminase
MRHLEAYCTREDLKTRPFNVEPGMFVIGRTKEWVQLSNHLAASVEGRSSQARLGLVVHLTAPKIDPGFSGQITLEMYNYGRFTLQLREGQRICSLIVSKLARPARTAYSGRFQNQGRSP